VDTEIPRDMGDRALRPNTSRTARSRSSSECFSDVASLGPSPSSDRIWFRGIRQPKRGSLGRPLAELAPSPGSVHRTAPYQRSCDSVAVFERFTERARQVVVLAQEEARTLKHNYIGTEHILLGLLREEEGLAARVLESLDITVERVRAEVVRIVGSGEKVTSGQIPFTPRAKTVLELALREALSLDHNYIGTEHILLGLVRENEGVAARILLDSDADSEKIRNEVIRMLSGPGGRRQGGGAATFLPLKISPTPAVADVIAAAADHATTGGRAEFDLCDVLLALTRDDDDDARGLFTALGWDPDSARVALDSRFVSPQDA
jgi:Clp amino terminal domain, pathogenicity island component